MKKFHQQKGFTLVELAIVLTIIGLLIGGILKGQQLMTNARVTATIAQISAIEAASTTFRDTYAAIPGDMLNADTRLPNCAACGVLPANGGNGIIGAPNWNMVLNQSASFTGGAAVANAAQETVLFWFMLSRAGLLSGITDAGVTNQPAAFGQSLPSARIGGGWTVGFSGGVAVTLPGAGAVTTMGGTTLTLLTAPNGAPSAAAGVQVLTAAQAAQIDRKMDDGMPGSGEVQAYGLATSCYSQVAPFTAANRGYSELTTGRDCGIYFRIQG